MSWMTNSKSTARTCNTSEDLLRIIDMIPDERRSTPSMQKHYLNSLNCPMPYSYNVYTPKYGTITSPNYNCIIVLINVIRVYYDEMGDPDSAYSFESSALIHGSPFFSAKKMDEPDEETLVKSGRIGKEIIFTSSLHFIDVCCFI